MFLWSRAEALARSRQQGGSGLTRVRVGNGGLTPRSLEEIGTRLRVHELVRVSRLLVPGSGSEGGVQLDPSATEQGPWGRVVGQDEGESVRTSGSRL